MIGTRKHPEPNGDLLLAEGEYGKATDGIWYCRPPTSQMGRLTRHTVIEHEDGTITVKPSILINDGRSEWHGFLERGVWRAVE